MGVNLLTYEVGICLDVFETSDSAIVGHTEKQGSAFRVGKSADALEPVADLLTLQFILEVVCGALGYEFVLSCRAPWFSFPSPKHALELVSCCFQNELIPRYSKMHLSLSKNRWCNGGAITKKNRILDI